MVPQKVLSTGLRTAATKVHVLVPPSVAQWVGTKADPKASLKVLQKGHQRVLWKVSPLVAQTVVLKVGALVHCSARRMVDSAHWWAHQRAHQKVGLRAPRWAAH
jgi:hypothetical protein